MADKFSYLSNSSPEYVDQLYQEYRRDPASVGEEWKRFFEGFELGQTLFNGKTPKAGAVLSGASVKEINVLNLINGYRTRGHLFSVTNPVRHRRKYSPTLDLENFGLGEQDLDTVFQAGQEVGLGPAPLRDILALLKHTYCDSIGVEFMYLSKPDWVQWFSSRMERERNSPKFDRTQKLHILEQIYQAVAFEQFLDKKYVGQKRFSLEGAEVTIPALHAAIEKGASLGIQEFIIGMAHRGRLNVLANILQKDHDEIFSEFEGLEHADAVFQGDVKYHLGFSSNIETREGHKAHLSLLPNPSHLETVGAVVEGAARAKIDQRYEGDFSKLAPILIHGDAAVAAQGIVYEIIQMSLLEGYKTGGTIHLIINNQVGFTTNYLDARSSTYCTDIAKTTLSPVFHVNGDDAEAVVYAVEMAMEYRQQFKRDVFIDLLCYRRHGHNEADEPSFTQPLLYDIIRKHPNPYQIYVEKLQKEAGLSETELEQIIQRNQEHLNRELEEAKASTHLKGTPYFEGAWKGLRRVSREDFDAPSPVTGLPDEQLRFILNRIQELPEGFKAHKKILKLYEDRRKMVENNNLDWALGELLAYGTLLMEGKSVRLSGQDCKRGTFSHRHASIFSTEDETEFIPLNHLSDSQGKFQVYNSLLSEYGVLGFEYGYSMVNPNQGVIWEAQFGDFANGAQIIVDQYLSSAETKWQRMSGLMMFLPHGFEGQGPEHSSARIERYLELCANKNMQVLNITTPANFYHALRRQLNWAFRIPAIFITPKKLLRYPKCVSPLEDFGPGSRFQDVIDDAYVSPADVRRVLLCSGKIYYDLLEAQQKDQRNDVAIVRMEQLYPLPVTRLREMIAHYPNATEYFWVQEEPRNMGAWSYILRVITDVPIKVIARKPSPSPATGYYKQHDKQQQYIVWAAFNLADGHKEQEGEVRQLEHTS